MSYFAKLGTTQFPSFKATTVLFVAACIVSLSWIHTLSAAVDPVVVRFIKPEAWVGENVTFYVDIRVKGSFGGPTNFNLPSVPETVIMKAGNPTVSSEQIEGESWFVQIHRFSLFSQNEGTLEIPEFTVHYEARDGYTGPSTEITGTVPKSQVTIKRPPGSENIGFLVTTESLKITETWNPSPNDAQAGTVFKRTLQQEANNVSGIALEPLPRNAPDGIRVYADDPIVSDNTQRGAFIGTRSETISYFLREPGDYTLPEITFVWWDPKKEELLSKTLPSVSFNVTPAPYQQQEQTTATDTTKVWPWIALAASLALAFFILKFPVQKGIAEFKAYRNKPGNVAKRTFKKACQDNDAKSAYHAWLSLPYRPSSPELAAEIQKLGTILYGAQKAEGQWNGSTLYQAYRKAMHDKPASKIQVQHLPPLNP